MTVVFVDLAASTELAARLDPERYREVLAAFHGAVTDEITVLGGRAEGFIGDAVLGVFGVPTLHDDDAQRGIRAALAVVDRTARLQARLGLPMPMEVRIGVNTGRVAVGTATDRNLVIGAEVNIGARLQQAAAPGEILVGETTHQLTAGSVEYGPMRSIEAKGFDDEIAAWPVIGLTGGGSRKSIPLVNRLREMALLGDTFERVQERGRAHLVTLLGEPGIGKSRVVEEFLGTLPDGGEGALRSLEPVRGGGHVLAARPDGLPGDRGGTRRSGGAGPRTPPRDRGRLGGARRGRPGGAAAGVHPGARRGGEPGEPLPRGRGPQRHPVHAHRARVGWTRRARLRGPPRGGPAPARPDRAARQGGPQGAADDGVRGPLGVPRAASRTGPAAWPTRSPSGSSPSRSPMPRSWP